MSLRTLSIDLTGSKRMGPVYRSVEVVVECDWPDSLLRWEAANYYGVPLGQVGQPRPTAEDAAA